MQGLTGPTGGQGPTGMTGPAASGGAGFWGKNHTLYNFWGPSANSFKGDGTGNTVCGFGAFSGTTTLGNNNVIIGYKALSTGDASGCIFLNATGVDFNPPASDSSQNRFYVKPVRKESQTNALYYDKDSGEITYDASGGGGGGGGAGVFGRLVKMAPLGGFNDVSAGLPPLPDDTHVKVTLVGGGGGGGGVAAPDPTVQQHVFPGAGGGGGGSQIYWTTAGELSSHTFTGGAGGAAAAPPAGAPPTACEGMDGSGVSVAFDGAGWLYKATGGKGGNFATFYQAAVPAWTGVIVNNAVGGLGGGGINNASGIEWFGASEGAAGGAGGTGILTGAHIAYNGLAGVGGMSAVGGVAGIGGNGGTGSIGADYVVATDGGAGCVIFEWFSGGGAIGPQGPTGEGGKWGLDALNSNFWGPSGNSFNGGSGSNNTVCGVGALNNGNSGDYNTAVGNQALNLNTASFNTAVGSSALAGNNTGSGSTAVGYLALANNNTGSSNTAVGNGALLYNEGGESNTAVGTSALAGANPGALGSNNTAVGAQALGGPYADGSGNTAVGTAAGFGIGAGSNNLALGYNALSTGDANNCIVLNATGAEFGPDSSGVIYDGSGNANNDARFYVKPIAKAKVTQSNILNYDVSSGEITYGNRGVYTFTTADTSGSVVPVQSTFFSLTKRVPTIPAAAIVKVTLIGGGGAGSIGGANSGSQGGGGGGGGAFLIYYTDGSSISGQYVQVGGGGQQAAAGVPPGFGGTTAITPSGTDWIPPADALSGAWSTNVAVAAGGGGSPTAGAIISGGVGGEGFVFDGTGTVVGGTVWVLIGDATGAVGGDGGPGDAAGAAEIGGGGGAGAGPAGPSKFNGANASASAVAYTGAPGYFGGGNGGTECGGSTCSAGAGSAPGAGGGGGAGAGSTIVHGDGGKGADGLVMIEWWT
jgi:hypothetical protein